MTPMMSEIFLLAALIPFMAAIAEVTIAPVRCSTMVTGGVCRGAGGHSFEAPAAAAAGLVSMN